MASVLKKSSTALGDGFIPVSRKLFDNFLWKEKREFSHAEAWLDLIQLARFEANPTKEVINGQVIEYGMGERPLSLRLLADRWQWSKNRVDKFLDLLVSERMITKRTAFGTAKGTADGTDKGTGKRTRQTVISICNYASYNSKEEIAGQPKGQQEGQQTGQVTGQSRDNINKENKYNILLTCAHESRFLDQEITECFEVLKADRQWIEFIMLSCFRRGHKDLTEEKVTGYLEMFFLDLQARGEDKKALADAKSHFANWIRIELEKQQKHNGTNKRTTGSSQSGSVQPEEIRVRTISL